MKQKTYSELLKDPRWQKKRLQIMERDGFACKLCGNKEKTLHVHHLAYTKKPWDADDKELVTLCESCHTLIHSYEPTEIINQGILSPYDFILLDPIMIYAALSLIENHKGHWIIQFRKTANPYHIINVTFLLFDFIYGMDGSLSIRYIPPDVPGVVDDIEMFDALSNFRNHV